MFKNWKTSLSGIVLAILLGAQSYGVKIGHVGNGDYLGLLTAIAAGALGVSAADTKKPEDTPGTNVFGASK